MNRVSFSLLLFSLLLAAQATAEVLDSGTHGFTSRNVAAVDATPTTVYAALVQDVSSWWSSDHTISGSAENLRIDAQQGGCFCEVLPGGGSVRRPGKRPPSRGRPGSRGNAPRGPVRGPTSRSR